MRKIATTLINNIKDYVNENPDMVKNVLGAGALGAGAGGLLFGGGSKYETTGQKVKRRLKNALIGGALASGAAAMLTNGAKQLATAMPAEKETPYEAMSKVPTSGAARTLYAATGAGLGKSIANKLKASGIQELKSKLTRKNVPSVFAEIAQQIPSSPITDMKLAKKLSQELSENLAANPDVMHKLLGTASGPGSAESVKKVRDLLHAAGVNTSKMTKALPGYIPFTNKALADFNMDNKLGRWLISKKPVEKLVRFATGTKTAPLVLKDINMDNSAVRSILHPGVGKGLVTGLATAGAFAPEIISAVNKVRSAL